MVTSRQIVEGVTEYAHKDIMPKLEPSQQFMAGIVLGIAGGKADGMLKALAQQPMIAALGVVQPNGEVDLDTLYAAASAQMDKQGSLPIDIPIIGRMTFDRGDLDNVYRAICRR